MSTFTTVLLCILALGVVLAIAHWFLVFKGSAARAAIAQQKLKATLMAHEQLVNSAIQLRVFATMHRRQLIALTSSRLIVITRALFGGFEMKDYQWKDLQSVELSENIMPHVLGSKIAFNCGAGSVIINGIDSETASKLYAHAQYEEQAWEEKRRVRELEEKRAASGGMMLNAGGGGSAAAGGSADFLEDLEKAKKLFDSGAVSDAEYQEIKAKILSNRSF